MEVGARPSGPSSRQPHNPVSRAQSPPGQSRSPSRKGARQHVEHPRLQSGTFPSHSSEFSCVTISLLIENQDSVIFLQRKMLMLQSFGSQGYGTVILERIQPPPLTELDTKAQRSQDWAQYHTAGGGRARREHKPPDFHGPPASVRGLPRCLHTIKTSLVALIVSC